MIVTPVRAVIEPFASGTDINKFGAKAVLHVLPSDHDVAVDAGHLQAVERAAAAARTGQLVTFGIVPTSPDTGYVYIQSGAESSAAINAGGSPCAKEAAESCPVGCIHVDE